jgi:transposase
VTYPADPVNPARAAGKASHDYVRTGTTTLFAALEVATGKVLDACYLRHRHHEFLRFLRQVAKAYPRRQLHIVCDNYGTTHKHPKVRAWLARHARIQLHFTPTGGSWLNMVEVFFSIITRQAIRGGSFTSVKDLIAAIEAFIDGWNDRCQPFVWTKTADQLLPHRHRRPKNIIYATLDACATTSTRQFFGFASWTIRHDGRPTSPCGPRAAHSPAPRSPMRWESR